MSNRCLILFTYRLIEKLRDKYVHLYWFLFINRDNEHLFNLIVRQLINLMFRVNIS